MLRQCIIRINRCKTNQIQAVLPFSPTLRSFRKTFRSQSAANNLISKNRYWTLPHRTFVGEENSYANKKPSQWSEWDLLQWFKHFEPFPSSFQKANLLTGTLMESIDQSGLESLDFTANEAQSILQSFSNYQALIGQLDNEVRLRMLINHTAAKMKQVLQLSQDLAYQQAKISPLVKNCLPLATNWTRWDSSYFPDIQSSPVYPLRKVQPQNLGVMSISVRSRSVITSGLLPHRVENHYDIVCIIGLSPAMVVAF